MKLIHGNDSADAWRKAADHLSSLPRKGWDSNLVVHISQPSIVEDTWFDLYNPKTIRSKGDALKDVANTIFPSATWGTIVRRGQNRDAFYTRYKKIYKRGKTIGIHSSRNKRAWGTYFLRLISFGDSSVNQLETAILTLRTWANHHHGAITFHTSTLEYDSYRVAGGPCWHFGELC